MNFAAIVVGTGIAGALLVAYLQGPPLPVAAELSSTVVLDPTATAAISRGQPPPASTARRTSVPRDERSSRTPCG